MIQRAIMTSKLKAADPTMVPGPKGPASNVKAKVSIMASKISGALEPRANKVKLATVSFQTSILY